MKARAVCILLLSFGLVVPLALPRTVLAPWAPPPAREESDIDGNGVINILDIAIVAFSFGTACAVAPCPAAWDTRADINNNGVINIIDIATVAFYFGTTCGVPTPGWNSNADIDNDNAVTPADSAIFAPAYPSSLGSVGWNPEADMNGDAYVNTIDAAILGTASGSSC